MTMARKPMGRLGALLYQAALFKKTLKRRKTFPSPGTIKEEEEEESRTHTTSSSSNDRGKKGRATGATKNSNSISLWPLSDANVLIATMDKRGNKGGSKKASRRQLLSSLVTALGGNVLPQGSGVGKQCHVVLLDLGQMSSTATQSSNPLQAAGIHNPKPFLKLVEQCKSRNIPIVSPLWLERVAGLKDNEDWRSTVDNHVPPVLALLLQSKNQDAENGHANSQPAWRRDSTDKMGKSIADTFQELTQQDPSLMEEESIRRAIEISLSGQALTFFDPSNCNTGVSRRKKHQKQDPYKILGVHKYASADEIKNAYRKLARIHHPDKGGDTEKFAAIAKAYRSLLKKALGVDDDLSTVMVPKDGFLLKNTSHWARDKELQDHCKLVDDLFQSHGGNLEETVRKQALVIRQHLGLRPRDAGATNINEHNEPIANSCFYLSLATSYLSGIGAFCGGHHKDDRATDRAMVQQTALQLKRSIEAAVVRAHPEWAAQGMVGEEIQAFSDFLTYSLQPDDDCRDDSLQQMVLSNWAVVIFDSASGFCDVYKGCNYDSHSRTAAERRANTITLYYLPGHYQPLMVERHRIRPTLKEILTVLEEEGVMYVVTDGS